MASTLLKTPKFSTPKKRAARIIAATLVKNEAACPNESEKTFLVSFSMTSSLIN
ncbi:MAG: hypothetical protein KF816_05060 [Melioribacteraceae bacterium]|jgi:hypothetical protein|nr:hypothetical protein [Melioribacteraceae bacterium]